jgi:hypothetical protein
VLADFLKCRFEPTNLLRAQFRDTLFICRECFRKAESVRALPRGVRATICTRRSSALSTRLNGGGTDNVDDQLGVGEHRDVFRTSELLKLVSEKADTAPTDLV